jgi:CheY-like chemotaxis protein
VLLVDDNEDTIRLLSRLLERRGHHVSVAYDGLTGLQAAQNIRPDVFILDIGLPGIDGYELARRLRTEGFAEVLIIALSGYAQEGDRVRSREAGFDHHFAKPVDVDSLAQLIAVPVGAAVAAES